MADDEASRFWAFSQAIYADPEVAAAALRLHDAQGRDVNLALYCLYAGFVAGRELDEGALACLAAAVESWNEEVVRPLRAVRRRLKGREDAAELRAGVAAAKLEAERLAQARLVAAGPAGPPAEAAAATAWRNLSRYAGAAGRPLFAAAASRLAAGLAPAPDRAAVEPEEVEHPAERLVDHLLDRGGPGV